MNSCWTYNAPHVIRSEMWFHNVTDKHYSQPNQVFGISNYEDGILAKIADNMMQSTTSEKIKSIVRQKIVEQELSQLNV